MKKTNLAASEESLFAQELTHRTANLLQQALAALHMARKGDGEHIDAAWKRLSGAADVQHILRIAAPGSVDLTTHLNSACEAVGKMNGVNDTMQLVVGGETLIVDNHAARTVSMIVVELVGNSIRHGLQARAGSITVSVQDDGENTLIAVEDDGVGGGWSRSGGQGHGIVDALAATLGGQVLRRRTACGISRVEMTSPSLALTTPLACLA